MSEYDEYEEYAYGGEKRVGYVTSAKKAQEIYSVLEARKKSPLLTPKVFDGPNDMKGCLEVASSGLYAKDLQVAPFFTVIGIGYDRSNGESVLILSYLDSFNNERTLRLPRRVLGEGERAMAQLLLANDFFCSADRSLRTRLLTLLTEIRGPRVLMPDANGWLDTNGGKVFVMGARIIGEANETRVDTSVVPGQMKFDQGGTFDGWKETIGTYSATNSRLMLAVTTMLSSITLPFAPDVNASIFHIYGRSSSGKTIAVGAGNSVWGNGADPREPGSFGHSWNGTSNAVVALAASHSGIGISLDELQTFKGDPEEVVYAVGNGQRKQRLNRDGGLREAKSFATMVLSAGEDTIDALLRRRSRRDSEPTTYGGAEVRFPSIPADANKGHRVFDDICGHSSGEEFALAIAEASRTHYGHAGPALAAYIQDTIANKKDGEAEIREDLKTWAGEFRNIAFGDIGEKPDTTVLRICRMFAHLAGTGKLAVEAGILNATNRQVDEALAACFQAFLRGRGGTVEAKIDTAAMLALRDLVTVGRNRFVHIKDADSVRPLNQAGYIDGERDDEQFYIFPKVWQNEIVAVAPGADIVARLTELDLIDLHTGGKSSITKTINGKKSRFYSISSRVAELNENGSFEDKNIEGDCGPNQTVVVALEKELRVGDWINTSELKQIAREARVPWREFKATASRVLGNETDADGTWWAWPTRH